MPEAVKQGIVKHYPQVKYVLLYYYHLQKVVKAYYPVAGTHSELLELIKALIHQAIAHLNRYFSPSCHHCKKSPKNASHRNNILAENL